MADRTSIEWCDSTWNPWIGCTRVSPACDHCYAAVSTPARTLDIAWGAGQSRRRTSAANWKLPLRWQAIGFFACPGCGWRGDVRDRHFGSRCPRCPAETVPARRRVFCASLADVFDNEVDHTWRRDLFEVIRTTPGLDWLLLTKRIGNVRAMLEHQKLHSARYEAEWRFFDDWLAGRPPANVWLGATICNQSEADRDVPKLLAVPAAVRFLSIEPLLGPVDLARAGAIWSDMNGVVEPTFQQSGRHVSWVIAGGESCAHARPMHPEWARKLRDQCADADVPFLFKQWGEWQVASLENGHFGSVMPATSERYTWLGSDGRTTNPSANGLADAYAMARVGKKAAGRLLDGKLHAEFPGAARG